MVATVRRTATAATAPEDDICPVRSAKRDFRVLEVCTLVRRSASFTAHGKVKTAAMLQKPLEQIRRPLLQLFLAAAASTTPRSGCWLGGRYHQWGTMLWSCQSVQLEGRLGRWMLYT